MDNPDVTKLPDKYQTKLMLDHFLNGEIDINTFKRILDLIYEKDRKPEDMGYAYAIIMWFGQYHLTSGYDLAVMILASQAKYSGSNPGIRTTESNDIIYVSKKELGEYVRFRNLSGLNKNWLCQINLCIKNYLIYCNWAINREKTLKYLNKIQNKYAVSSYRKQILQIRLFLQYKNIDWLNKVKIISEPEYTPRRITEEDIDTVLRKFEGHKYELQVRALIYLGASSGLRAQELYQLTPRDLDMENRIVYVNHNPQNKQTTKTGKSRVSFFDYRAQGALKSHIRENKLRYLFGGIHISRLFRDSDVKVKDMRKKFSQEWDRRNGSFAVKERLMGHSMKRVDFQHYSFLDENDLKKVYDKVMLQERQHIL